VGCRSVSRIAPEPVSHPKVPINLDYIERCALLDQWGNIRDHLVQVDGDALPSHSKPLALFWMGVAQHNLGNASAAAVSWERALELHPSAQLKGRIQRAQGALRSYGAPQAGGRDQQGSTLQYGVFSLRKSAEDLAKELSWKGVNVQITRAGGPEGTLWTVWSGPYSADQARIKQVSLQERQIAAIVKSSRHPDL